MIGMNRVRRYECEIALGQDTGAVLRPDAESASCAEPSVIFSLMVMKWDRLPVERCFADHRSIATRSLIGSCQDRDNLTGNVECVAFSLAQDISN